VANMSARIHGTRSATAAAARELSCESCSQIAQATKSLRFVINPAQVNCSDCGTFVCMCCANVCDCCPRSLRCTFCTLNQLGERELSSTDNSNQKAPSYDDYVEGGGKCARVNNDYSHSEPDLDLDVVVYDHAGELYAMGLQ
jgi:hypothetical protein